MLANKHARPQRFGNTQMAQRHVNLDQFMDLVYLSKLRVLLMLRKIHALETRIAFT